MISILQEYWKALLDGSLVTLQVSFLSWTIGILIGFLIGLSASRKPKFNALFGYMSFTIAAIPVLVTLYWFHYPAQTLAGVVIHPFYTTVFVLSMINAILVADVVNRDATQIAKEHLEAAFIHGWSRREAVKKIEIPLIIRASAGQIIFIQVSILHMTLFASLISLDELFRVAQRINSIEFKPVEIYTLLALFYFALSAPLLFLSVRLRTKFGRNFSER